MLSALDGQQLINAANGTIASISGEKFPGRGHEKIGSACEVDVSTVEDAEPVPVEVEAILEVE